MQSQSELKVPLTSSYEYYNEPPVERPHTTLINEDEHEVKAPAVDVENYSSPITEIITAPNIKEKDSKKRAKAIVEKFNDGLTEKIIVPANWLRTGIRLEPNEFMLAHKNKVAEIAITTGDRLTTAITGPYTASDMIGRYDQNAKIIGAYGKYVVNVPNGQYALAWSGIRPLILDSGTHVIHDPALKLDESKFVNQSETYIKHGNLHILRVPPGMYGKVTINGKQILLLPSQTPYAFNTALFNHEGLVHQTDDYIHHGTLHIIRVKPGMYAKIIENGEAKLLEPRAEPYRFNNAFFEFNPRQDFVSQNENYIQHGNLHIIRVPPGQVAKVFENGEAKLCYHRKEPYEFNTPVFKYDPILVNQSDVYIQHGTKHIINVPKGYIAKVWVGTKPELLEARDEPYIYDDPKFRFEKGKDDKGGSYLLERSDAKLIVHGSIKRIIPPIGEFAITNKDGKMEIITEKTYIDSPTHSVIGFQSTAIQSVNFPSDKTKAQRIRDNKDITTNEKNYIICTTSDSVKIALQLLVAFSITNPVLALSQLKDLDGILDHIEGLATADIAKAMQECSSQEFLRASSNIRPKKPGREKKEDSEAPSAPEVSYSYQDIVIRSLHQQLKEYGIELIRMNIEQSKILNETISSKIEDLAINTAKASADRAALDLTWQIKAAQARQEAEVKQIAQTQENTSLIAAAEAKRSAAKLEAEAKLEIAKAEALSKIELAKAEAESIKMISESRNKSLEIEGKLYETYPQLAQVHMSNKKFEALRGVQMTITPGQMDGLFSSGLSLFAGMPTKPRQTETPLLEEKQNTSPKLS